MDLSGRKIKILEAIITDYIQTGEPVGSRTISKKYPLGISSATIRNEMSDLEDLGLLCQPHTSAGRIPSDKGYRLYVDRLMKHSALSEEESLFLKDIIINNIGHIDYLMEQTAKALARLTNCATVVAEAENDDDSIVRISLLPIDNRSVVLVTLTKNKKVKNTVLRADFIPDIDTLNQIAAEINNYISLYGKQINRSAGEAILKRFEPCSQLIAAIFSAVTSESVHNLGFYTSGVNNILNYPEFADINKAKNIFKTLEQRELIASIFANNPEDGIQIIIGGENSLAPLKDLSVIKTNYSLGSGNIGFIGIIGPTRMNYQQAVSVLNGMISSINDVIKALTGG